MSPISSPPQSLPPHSEPHSKLAPQSRQRVQRLLFCIACLALLLTPAWIALFRLGSSSDLHSYLPLIPLLSCYLLWLDRDGLRNFSHVSAETTSRRSLGLASCLGAGALLMFSLGWMTADRWDVASRLGVQMTGFCLGTYALIVGILGTGWLHRLAFPCGFLLFLIPLPPLAVDAMETFFQHTSAEVAYWFIHGAGIPVLREGLIFKLPTITLEVAPQCSGIRSSWMLFLTAVLASKMMLSRNLNRWILVLFVIPLGIVRNGFRILVLAWLCVERSPAYIDSPIHHQGGPLFFGLSLIPFGILLGFLRKTERKQSGASERPVPLDLKCSEPHPGK